MSKALRLLAASAAWLVGIGMSAPAAAQVAQGSLSVSATVVDCSPSGDASAPWSARISRGLAATAAVVEVPCGRDVSWAIAVDETLASAGASLPQPRASGAERDHRLETADPAGKQLLMTVRVVTITF